MLPICWQCLLIRGSLVGQEVFGSMAVVADGVALQVEVAHSAMTCGLPQSTKYGMSQSTEMTSWLNVPKLMIKCLSLRLMT